MTKVIMMGSQDPGDQIHISCSLCLLLSVSHLLIFFFFQLADLEMFAYLASDQIHTRSICGSAEE